MVHIRLPHNQQWHSNIGPTMTLGLYPGMKGAGVKCLAKGDSLLVLAFIANHWTPSCQSRLRCCSWKIMDHPPYSPDLARSDFCCFEPLMKQLTGICFVADTNLKQVVTPCLQALDTIFLVCCYTSIIAMVGQTHKCLLWLDGSLMCTICYPCAFYTQKLE
jgi:hypothetical protein